MKKWTLLPVLLLALCCLFGCGTKGEQTGEDTPPAAKESGGENCSYTVSCRGEDGTPVAGVMINFCTDTACSPVISGEDGSAVFTGAPEEYHVQIVKIPADWELLGEAEWTAGPGSESYSVTFREAGR